MNLAVRIALIVILGSVAQYYFPWWSVVLVAFSVELILGKGGKHSFFAGFYGVSIPWILLSAYIDIKSESILSVRILELFKLPQYGVVMVVLTGLLGGLAGGIASLSAGWVKAPFIPRRRNYETGK